MVKHLPQFLAWLDPSEACSIVQVPKRSAPDRSQNPRYFKVWFTLIARVPWSLVLKLEEAVLQENWYEDGMKSMNISNQLEDHQHCTPQLNASLPQV